MNYSYSISNYVSILKKIIDNTSNTNFILSDECLFDHNNYFGYFNIYLLKEIIEILNDYYDINIKFILSIRSQYEYLVSLYAYDNIRMKKNFSSFDNLLNKILSDKNLSEIYQYDLLIKKIKKIFDSEILILPLEELEQNYESYINRIAKFLNIEQLEGVNELENNFINKNSELICNPYDLTFSKNKFEVCKAHDDQDNFLIRINDSGKDQILAQITGNCSTRDLHDSYFNK